MNNNITEWDYLEQIANNAPARFAAQVFVRYKLLNNVAKRLMGGENRLMI